MSAELHSKIGAQSDSMGADITPDAKCKLDNYYIEHFSVWFDIKMLFGTVKIVFTGDGAR